MSVRRLIVGSFVVLSVGFSFAVDNNIYCEYPETEDLQFVCKQNEKEIKVSELQVKDIKKDDSGIFGSIYYNNQLLRSHQIFSPMLLLKTIVDKPNKNIFLYNGFGDVCDVHTKIEKLGFNGVSYYTISYQGSLNPIITLETAKYTTTIYFSDNTKNYIEEPTSNNKYTGLYMKKVSKDTKKTTIRTLYSFSPISFKDACGGDDTIFNMFSVERKSGLGQYGLDGKYYVFETNTRIIKLNLTDTGKSIITKKK